MGNKDHIRNSFLLNVLYNSITHIFKGGKLNFNNRPKFIIKLYSNLIPNIQNIKEKELIIKYKNKFIDFLFLV